MGSWGYIGGARMQPNLEDKLIIKIEDAKTRVSTKLYKQFMNSKSAEERELIHAKTTVLKDLTFSLINDIRGNTDG